MRKVILFIAMSLDGYIADKNGNVDWLVGQDPRQDDLDTYTSFIESVDTVIMGYKTYDQIVSVLSPDVWVYEDLKSYVFTHKSIPSTHHIHFINDDVCQFVKELRKEEGKDIWICGGANIIQQLLQNDMIDEYIITIIPTILGKGISLFSTLQDEMKLEVKDVQERNGIVQINYQRKR